MADDIWRTARVADFQQELRVVRREALEFVQDSAVLRRPPRQKEMDLNRLACRFCPGNKRLDAVVSQFRENLVFFFEAHNLSTRSVEVDYHGGSKSRIHKSTEAADGFTWENPSPPCYFPTLAS